MSNPKVFEFAKEVGMTPLALMDKIREWHLPVKSHMAELEPEVLEQIKQRLNEKGAEAAKKKTVARKAPAAKKPEAAVAPKKATASPAAAKKAPPAAAPKSSATVVRRKSVAEMEEALQAQAPVQARTQEPEPVVQKAPEEVVEAPAPKSAPEERIENKPALARKKEVSIGGSGVASSSTPAAQVGRKNIIGRMDLSRVQQPGGGPSGGQRPGGPAQRPAQGGGGFPAGPARSGSRNLRAGFVAATEPQIPDFPDDSAKNKKFVDKKSKKLEGAPGPAKKETEEEVKDFNAVEFRKREMVFQPKKRKEFLNRAALQTQITKPKASKRIVKVNGTMKLADLAQEIGVKNAQLTKVLMTNGVMATPTQDLDFDTIALIVPEFGWEAQNVSRTAEEVITEMAFGDLEAPTVIRPPVVTIMGHVDHGKTSLLDTIRKTDVAAGEAGGITQHIGAYSVKLEDGSLVTFLDTPGHEAFTAMRARGANATDIAIIVVAADDGMMPQTAEAINHAKAANVPIIVAINKMDKPGANPDRIKQQLTEFELVPEEWGGTTIYAPVSAIKKTGIKELLEHIKLVAEMGELKANPKKSATGIVIEAKLDKGRGPVATLLVKDGTIKVGQYVVAGSAIGRARSLTNDKGERVEEVGPGMPVEILGLGDVPQAGDRFDVVKDEATAEKISGIRKEQARIAASDTKKLSLEDIFAKVTKGDVKELAIILKADVQGSLEAINGMLAKMAAKEVKVRVVHSAVGGITESDVLLAQTAKGIILGFNVRPDGSAAAKAKQIGVDIRSYSIVYEMMDDIKKAMAGLLTPDVVEKVMGRAEVRNTFSVPKIGTIAGCFVADGKISRTNFVRLVRDGKIIYEGKIGSLKRFKDDAKEVAQGFECGIGIENFNDVKVGDVIEAYVKEEIARELTPLDAST